MSLTEEISIQKDAEIELTIDSLSFGGQGVARFGNFVLFVQGALTGDRVRARIFRKKKNFAEARVIEVLEPSPYRVNPPCRHFGTCGGCKWQNADYTMQLEAKRANVQDVFERIGGFKDLNIPMPVASPEIYHYRNKMEFTFGDQPWLTPSEIQNPQFEKIPFALGLHVPERYDKVLPIDYCHLQSELGNGILNFTAQFTRESGLPPYAVKTGEGFWRFLVIRECAHTKDVMVNIITYGDNAEVLHSYKNQLINRFPSITSVINGISQKKSQVAFSDYEILLHGKSFNVEKLGRYEFEISSNSFFQTNTRAAEKLYDVALEQAQLKGPELLYDLYCGTGSIAIYFSDAVGKVVGIELVQASVENAKQNARRNSVTNCEFIHGDMRETIKSLGGKPDVVIVDPPRSGLHGDVIDALINMAPEKIVYVSCNPATQARDAALFCRDRYIIDRVQPVDMFPHTYHIENVVRFMRMPK